MSNIQNRMSWSTKNNEERHKGSYDLDEIKNSELYKNKLNPDSNSVKRKYAICFGYLGSVIYLIIRILTLDYFVSFNISYTLCEH